MAEAMTGHHRAVHTESRVGIETIATRVVYWVFAVIEILLGLRFLLELFAANASAAFVQLIYRLSDGLMAPFYSVFPTGRVEAAVFDWSALLAMLVYALIGWAIIALIHAVSPRDSSRTVEEHDVERTET